MNNSTAKTTKKDDDHMAQHSNADVQLKVNDIYCSLGYQFSVQVYCRMLMKEFLNMFSY